VKRPILIGLAVVAIGVIVFFSIRNSNGDAQKVYAESAKGRTIQAVVTAPGEIDPKLKVNISAYVIGKIEKLYFDEGDRVKKGQKLVELERPAYVAQRDRMRSQLANQRIEVQRSKSALATAELTYKRAQNMQQQGIQAQELFDKARLDYQNAQALYASAQEGVHQAQAGLVQAENDLSHTTIESPIDGKVVQLNAREGEVVITGTMNNPGSVIAIIADLSDILVKAEVGETDVVGIRGGQAASIRVDAIPEKEYKGHVVEIGSSANVRQSAGSGVRYFTVKTSIDNADDRLRPGMTSQVSIVTSTVANTVAVPIQSVVERVPNAKKGEEDSSDENLPKKKYVFVVKDGKVRMVEVRTGISDATHVALLSGIKIGDMVVTGPFRTLKKLSNGEAVEISKEEKQKPTKDKKEES
jgi:HlyD family secretion protein